MIPRLCKNWPHRKTLVLQLHTWQFIRNCLIAFKMKAVQKVIDLGLWKTNKMLQMVSTVFQRQFLFFYYIFCPDEVWFHSSGYMHAQNSLYGLPTTHMPFIKFIYMTRRQVWIAVSRRTVGQIFFAETLNSDHYCEIVHHIMGKLNTKLKMLRSNMTVWLRNSRAIHDIPATGFQR